MAMCMSPSRLLAAATTWLLTAFVSAQFTEDFGDGDYTANPAWSGSGTLFIVADDAGNQRLRSNSAGAANYYLSTPNTSMADTRWDIFVDLRFSTSGANYADLYLASDAADLTTGVNGYFLRFGGTADRIELFRSDAGTPVSTGLQSPDGVVNSSTSNPFLLRTERSAAGVWTLQYDDGATGTYLTAGSITDATFSTTTHFGVRIEQSTAGSAVNNHFFDDISVGPIPVDLDSPDLVSATVISDTEIDLVFSEAVEQITAEEENNYSIIPFNSAAAVVRDAVDFTLVHLTLAIAMQNGNTYSITVNGVEDAAGNPCVNETADVTYVIPDVAEPGDVVINEIMADPSPVVGLPDAEFVELFNTTTDKTFDLAGWTYSDGGDESTLPAATLAPGGHIMITSPANIAALSVFGTAIAPSGSVSLTNTDDPITIKDPIGVTIDAVTYSDDWYNDAAKAAGGWTLERIDPTTPCSSSSNWTASNDALGGTPGEQNSVFAIIPDVTAPTLVSVFVNSATQIELLFNETMSASSLFGGSYQFIPALNDDLVLPLGDDRVRIDLATPLTVGQLYTVTVSGVTDCVGNAIGTSNTLTFALPESALPGDVVINEVLYDPLGSGSDFVELYNRSNKVLSLAGWKLANETGGIIGNATVITTAAFLLMPGEYALITESADNIATQYLLSRTDRFVEADMPSYNNGEGVVVLQDPAGDTLDRFAYTDDLHFELLNSTDGVSLERVNPDRPASDNSNWHSAAEAVGYATPGYLNSQYSVNPAPSGELTIDPAVFSPDNDGFQDVLTVGYKLDEPGFTGTMIVFDVAGREMVKLLDNELLGTTGAVSWNGIMESGDLARMGPYVVVFEAFDLQGNVERFRQTVVLAHKLN